VLRTLTFIIAAVLLFHTPTAVSQSQLVRAPGAHVVTISPPNVRGTEPAIAVNPNNPNQVVAAFQPATVAYSRDSAQTFSVAELPKSFSPPMRISTHAGLPRDDNGAVVGFVGVVGADGTIYAIWNDGETIAFTQSHDGGKTFSPSRSVIDVAPPYFGGAGGIPGVPRVMGFPQIGVDARPSGGGALYVCWSDFRNGDVDVFLSKSTDQGRTWSSPERVNNDPIHDGIDQFFQWMAVDPVSGHVFVQFYDRRDDPANRKTTFSLARSTDGGKTFANYLWTDSSFETQQAFLGDYTWLTAYADKVYGVWTEAVAPPPDTPAPPQGQARRPGSFTAVRVGFADFSPDK